MPEKQETEGALAGSVRMTRREVMRLGSLGLLGLGLPNLLTFEHTLATPVRPGGSFGSANKFLFVFLQGGPSHLDLWDPKPEAPVHIRGEFKAIKTRVPSILLTEVMPKLAQVIDRATLVRSCSYTPAGVFNHSAAIYEVLTGHQPDDCPATGRLGAPSPEDSPCAGAHFARLLPEVKGAIPFAVLPAPVRELRVVGKGADGGFYGSRFGPIILDSLSPAVGGSTTGEPAPLAARRALEIHRESSRLREAYGENAFGTSLLAARRLLESGSRVVQVNWPAPADGDPCVDSLDTHKGSFKALRDLHAPKLDAGLATLLEDMDARGLLAETVVLVMGEFGRGPKVGVSTSGNAVGFDGRDHWPYCFTALMAGGGIARGTVYGESDASGAYPLEKAVHPARLLATVYHAMGIKPDTVLTDGRGHPRALVRAEPIGELFG